MTFRANMALATRQTFERLGGPGIYVESLGADPVPCLVLVNYNVGKLGDFGSVVARNDQVKLLLEEVPNPKVGATVTVTETGRVYTLSSKDYADDFYTRWWTNG